MSPKIRCNTHIGWCLCIKKLCIKRQTYSHRHRDACSSCSHSTRERFINSKRRNDNEDIETLPKTKTQRTNTRACAHTTTLITESVTIYGRNTNKQNIVYTARVAQFLLHIYIYASQYSNRNLNDFSCFFVHG